HRIPAYFYGEGDDDFVVAETIEEAVAFATKKSGRTITENDLHQDPDVLDTWASSWLWPIEVFHGFNDEHYDKANGKVDRTSNADLNYFYPTQVLVTAPEILFFWVARMIIAGYEYMDERPFEDVYLTGIVRDKQGRKMSKSLGNSPDPLDLIKKYGADGVRTGMLFSSPAGNDLLFDEKLCEQGRNFSNKIWNAFRLVKGWETKETETPEENKIAAAWFESRLNQTMAELQDHYSKFRISDALLTAYKLVWNDFCAWYLEMVKPPFGEPIDKASYKQTVRFFESILKLLHPFMPFITEELWHELDEKNEKDCIIVAEYPTAAAFDEGIIDQAAFSFEVITQIRNIRNTKGISPKEPINLIVSEAGQQKTARFTSIIQKLSNVKQLSFSNDKPGNGGSFIVQAIEFFIPMEGKVDVEKEEEAIKKELEYTRGFLNSVMKKLGNERFVKGAPPAVLEAEQKKKADAESKIAVLEENLKALQG
ncbi:MAG: class I tRNA ligase family protein, partial [Cyclobacteriaceae bacterium]